MSAKSRWGFSSASFHRLGRPIREPALRDPVLDLHLLVRSEVKALHELEDVVSRSLVRLESRAPGCGSRPPGAGPCGRSPPRRPHAQARSPLAVHVNRDAPPRATHEREPEAVQRLRLHVLGLDARLRCVGDGLVERREEDDGSPLDPLDNRRRLARAGAGSDDEVALACAEPSRISSVVTRLFDHDYSLSRNHFSTNLPQNPSNPKTRSRKPSTRKHSQQPTIQQTHKKPTRTVALCPKQPKLVPNWQETL